MKASIKRLTIPSSILLFAIPALAVDNNWTGATSTDWNDPTNWSDPHGFGSTHVPEAGGAHPGDEDAAVNVTTNFPIITASNTSIPRDTKVGVGAGNSGRLDHVSGTHTSGSANWTFVGRDNGTGTYNLADTAGTGGTYSGFAQGSGNLNAGNRIMLGTNGSTGTMNVNTSGNINLGEHLIIGEAGGLGAANGTLNVDSGTFNVVNETWVGNNAGGSGTVNMSGGSITSGNWIAVGRNGSTGVVNLAGTSQMTMTNALDINAQITVGTGAGGNGTINVKDTAILTSSKMILGENDATSVGLIDQTGGTVAISDTLTVQGVGIGTYKLTGGVLIATNIGAEDGTFDMTGGRLESVTRFSGDLDQKGGILAPGASLGTMEITGNFALELPATFEMEADGSGNDMLMVGGDVNLLGDLDIIASAGLTTGTILTIIDNTGVNPLTGLFGNYATNGMTFTEDGYDWRIDYGVGSDNNDVTLTVLAVVPEPSAGILALLAIGLTFARRRR